MCILELASSKPPIVHGVDTCSHTERYANAAPEFAARGESRLESTELYTDAGPKAMNATSSQLWQRANCS